MSKIIYMLIGAAVVKVIKDRKENILMDKLQKAVKSEYLTRNFREGVQFAIEQMLRIL